MFEFKLPDVGEGIHEAEVLKWLVKVGDTVKQDQPILEIQTDKAVVEIPAPVPGRVAEIRSPAGQVAHVGDVLVVIDREGARQGRGEEKEGEGQGSRGAGEQRQTLTPALSQRERGLEGKPTVVAQSPIPNLRSPSRILAAPAVRKLALELKVDLARVRGTGPVGRVLPEDVRRAAAAAGEQRSGGAGGKERQEEREGEGDRRREEREGEGSRTLTPALSQRGPESQPSGVAQSLSNLQSPISPPAEVIERQPLQGLRRRIAERMEMAWRVPHVTSMEEVDATRLAQLRETLKPEAERRGARLTYMPLFIKVAVQALKEFPIFNATLDMDKGEILLRRYYHMGIATAIPDGLVVPVVKHADRLSMLQLALELTRLGEGARQRRLGVAELSGSTFTITNFGSFGGWQGTPIINPPEVAILGCGRIEDRAVVIEGRIEARPILPLALSYDHRLIDGAGAAQFLGRVKALIAQPEWLLLDMA